MPTDRDLRAAVEALPEELDQWADTFEEERAQGARSTAAFARALVRAILAEDPVTPAEARACAGCRQALHEQRLGPVGAQLWTCATAGCPGNLAERFGAPAEPDAGGEGLTEDQWERLTATDDAHDYPIVADRERRAEARGAVRALREAADAFSRAWPVYGDDWLRDRADRIAGEGQ